jgi:hypothetical protein
MLKQKHSQTSQAVISDADSRLTMTPRITPGCAGAKTQMEQEHAYKGQGSGWLPRAHAQVFVVCKEMSWLLANVSCRRIPGPIVQTTRMGTDHVSWTMLKRCIGPINSKKP